MLYPLASGTSVQDKLIVLSRGSSTADTFVGAFIASAEPEVTASIKVQKSNFFKIKISSFAEYGGTVTNHVHILKYVVPMKTSHLQIAT